MIRFNVTERDGSRVAIEGKYHTLTFAETMMELDPFQDAVPCWHPDSFIHVTISYYNCD